MNKIYTLQEVDDLIYEYKKTHNPKISLEIFKAFEGFIVKYAHFLKNGIYKKSDKDLMGLMRILNIKDTLNNPIKAMFNTWSSDDIFNELYLLFLKSINQFTKRKEGPYFTGYIYNYYKYLIKDWITELSQDALNSVHTTHMEDAENLTLPEPDLTEYENICLTEKTTLTQDEKYILHLYYNKKMTMDEISKMIGYDRVYLTKLKNQAKEKLISSGMLLEDFEKLDK